MREERTGWRDNRLDILNIGLGISSKWDEAISRRHRLWGNDLPAVDFDLILIEYFEQQAKAIIEYKTENAPRMFCPPVFTEDEYKNFLLAIRK
jgi:hypothetical protein